MTQTIILSTIKESPGIKQRDLPEITGIERGSFNKSLLHLLEAGMIRRVKVKKSRTFKLYPVKTTIKFRDYIRTMPKKIPGRESTGTFYRNGKNAPTVAEAAQIERIEKATQAYKVRN